MYLCVVFVIPDNLNNTMLSSTMTGFYIQIEGICKKHVKKNWTNTQYYGDVFENSLNDEKY